MNYTKVSTTLGKTTELMQGEIDTVRAFCHNLKQDEKLCLEKKENCERILFVVLGGATFRTSDMEYMHHDKGLFVPKPNTDFEIVGINDCAVLEIQVELTDDEWQELLSKSEKFPISSPYAAFPKYKEECKSEKTISRMIVDADILPRFAMGSVETYGDDRVEKHAHPGIEQFFFNFEESNMIVMIDDDEFPIDGATIMHIPHGSNHGARVEAPHHMHYLWIDFVTSEEGTRHLKEAHEMIDE